MEAANYRTWQLVQPLVDDGHTVLLAAGRIGPDFPVPPPAEQIGTLHYKPIRFSRPGWMGRVQGIHDEFRPEAILGVMFTGALRASRVRTDAPRWYDIYGDQMAEMQAAAYRKGSNRGIATQLGFFDKVLKTGDVFSACGPSQRHALIGQLSMAGRLNAATFGVDLVNVIPPGALGIAQTPVRGLLRGQVVDPDSHIILWCGGYNSWTDVETLFAGLELALRGDPKLHFVSVGGELPFSGVYARFCEQVGGSSERDRFHLLGWQPVATIPGYYVDADIGLTLDTACYEAELGTRTRLVEMMQYGVPIVTTKACDLSRTIASEGLGLTFPIGDSTKMAREILLLSLNDEPRQSASARAREYAATTLSLGSSTTQLRDWVRQPQHAPDRAAPSDRRVFSWRHELRALARQAIWSIVGLDH